MDSDLSAIAQTPVLHLKGLMQTEKEECLFKSKSSTFVNMLQY